MKGVRKGLNSEEKGVIINRISEHKRAVDE